MPDRCTYFESEEWAERRREFSDRLVDLKTAIWGTDGIDDTERVIGDIVQNTYFDRRELDERPAEEVLLDVPEAVLDWDADTVQEIRESLLDAPDVCPHDPVDGHDRCPFHLSPAERSACGITDDDLRAAFLRKIEAGGRENKIFIGATFGTLDLEQEILSADDNYPIRMEACTVTDHLNMSRTIINQPIDLSGGDIARGTFVDAEFQRDVEAWGVAFDGPANFKYATFGKDVEFWNGQFGDTATFFASRFEAYAEFRSATFDGRAQFKYTEVGRDIEFWDASFRDEAILTSMVIDNNAEFRYATFEAEANVDSARIACDLEFRYAAFHDFVTFEHLDVGGNTHYWGTAFHGYAKFRATHFDGYLEFNGGGERDATRNAVFHGNANFQYGEFEKDVEFWSVVFEGNADFRNANFRGTTEFQYAQFHGTVNFDGASHREIDFTKVRSFDGEVELTNNELPKGVITQPDEGHTIYDLTGATVGEVDLDAAGETNLFNYFRFYETDFEGFNFPEHRIALNKNWYIHRSEVDADHDLDPNELESTYLKAKNGADSVGDSQAASEFFMRELKFQRKSHWQNVREADSFRAKAKHSFKWGASWLYNLTCGYGERPFRTVLFAFGFITVFAYLYVLIGVQLPGNNNFFSYMTFSLQTFVTLILGGAAPTNQTILVRFLSAFEAFVGAFSIALFVFSLTRSLHR